MRRYRRNKKTVYAIITVIFIGAVIIATYLMQDNTEPQADYGKIGDINVNEDVLGEGEELTPGGEELTCVVMDCDDALSVLIDIGDTEILYDCGYADDGPGISKKIAGYVDGPLDYLIISHSHADHAGGAAQIAADYEIETCITSGEKKGSSQQYEDAMKAIEKEGCKVIEDADMNFDLGNNAMLNIYENLDPDQDDNPNNLSVIATVTYGQDTILLTGDAEKEAETRLKGKFSDVTLYIAGHHMSSTSNTLALLEEWRPEYIVGSCQGEGSQYGFPHNEAIRNCLAVTQNVFATYKSGDIIYKTNGVDRAIDCDITEALTEDDAA